MAKIKAKTAEKRPDSTFRELLVGLKMISVNTLLLLSPGTILIS